MRSDTIQLQRASHRGHSHLAPDRIARTGAPRASRAVVAGLGRARRRRRGRRGDRRGAGAGRPAHRRARERGARTSRRAGRGAWPAPRAPRLRAPRRRLGGPPRLAGFRRLVEKHGLDTEIHSHVTMHRVLSGWNEVDGKLEREFELDSFKGAIAFVNRVAELAEAENHHPDIEIHYKKVVLRW